MNRVGEKLTTQHDCQFHQNAHKHEESTEAKSKHQNQVFMTMHVYGNMRMTKMHEYKRINHEELIAQARVGAEGKI